MPFSYKVLEEAIMNIIRKKIPTENPQLQTLSRYE